MKSDLHFFSKGDGPALCLLHGFPLDSRIWSAQIDSLSNEFRVIAPDLRGFGRSPSAGPFTLETLADDVHDLLKQLSALPIVLAGLSMGGYISLYYARKYPADLRGLALIDTKAAGDTTEAKAARSEMIELAKTGGSTAVARQMLPKMLSPDHLNERPDLVESINQIMHACPAQTIQYACAAMRDRRDFTADLSSLAMPTMVLLGRHDQIIPISIAESITHKIPRARLEIIPDAGHMAPIENPSAVNRALRDFVRSCA